MNLPVLAFFLHNVLATVLLGGKFAKQGDPVFRNFGFALLLDALAFAVWSYAILARPTNLEDFVSWGTAIFIVSLLFLLNAGLQGAAQSLRRTLVIIGAVVGAVVFYVGGMAAFPSTPAISADGFFFFNVHPLLQALYVFMLALTAFPAIDAVARKFSGAYANLVRYGFTAAVAGGMILVTSTSMETAAQNEALYLAGGILGLVYLVLWVSLVFNRKAWAA